MKTIEIKISAELNQETAYKSIIGIIEIKNKNFNYIQWKAKKQINKYEN